MARTSRPSWSPERTGRWAFIVHVWAIFGLAASNIALAVALILARWAPDAKARLVRFRPILTPLVLYGAALAVSVTFSFDTRVSVREAGEILALVSLPMAAIWLRSARDIGVVVDGFVIVATLCSVWGLAQFGAGFGGLENRIRGPFSHYMTFAGVLLLAVAVCLAQLACRKFEVRQWRWAALLVLIAGLLGSLTRSAWVALAAGLVTLAVVRKPRWLLAGLPVLAIAAVLLPAPVRGRMASIFDLQNPSNYDRLSMLEAGAEMLRERPFFGIGPGMVRELYPIYRPLSAPRHSAEHLHNSFLHVAAEQGLVGLAALLWLLAVALGAAFRGQARGAEARGRDPAADELCLASFLGLVCFAVAGLFEANWLDTEVQRIALFLMAIPFALRPIQTESDARQPIPASASRVGE